MVPWFILEPYRFSPEKLVPLNKSVSVWSRGAVGTREGDALASSSPKNILCSFHRNSIDSHPDWNERGKQMAPTYTPRPLQGCSETLWGLWSCYSSLGQGMLTAVSKTRSGGSSGARLCLLPTLKCSEEVPCICWLPAWLPVSALALVSCVDCSKPGFSSWLLGSWKVLLVAEHRKLLINALLWPWFLFLLT